MEKKITRQLWHLAERLAINAEAIRNASKPWHLTRTRSRALRHLRELNKIKDGWSDSYKPTRRPTFPRPACRCDSARWWPGRRHFSQ